MKNLLFLLFFGFSIHTFGQDTIPINLQINYSKFPLSTVNPPVLKLFTRNVTSKDILLIEWIKSHPQNIIFWTIEMENDQGQRLVQSFDLPTFEKAVSTSNYGIEVKNIKPKGYFNKDFYPMFSPVDLMFEAWNVYGLPPGNYKIRVSYQLTLDIIEKLKAHFIDETNRFELDDLTLNLIQSNWVEFKIEQSDIHFSIDYQKVTFQKVENSYINWRNQLSVIQDGKHILERLYDNHNNIVAEFRPSQPTDKPTLINIKNKKFRIENDSTANGQYRWYVGNVYGINDNIWWQTMRGEGQVVNGKLEGVIYEYEPHSNRSKVVLNYKKGIQNGRHQHWIKTSDTTDFILKKEGVFKNGFPDGKYIEYYENGNIHLKKKYDMGLVDGKTTFFYENGQPLMIAHYKPELLKEKAYLSDSRILAGKLYRDNQVKHGQFITYGKDGKPVKKQTYKNNIPTGKNWQKVTIKGEIIEVTGYYKNGKPWKGQFINTTIHVTRGRYGTERTETAYLITYENGEIVNQKILMEGGFIWHQ